MATTPPRLPMPGFEDRDRSREYAGVLGPAARLWYRHCATTIRLHAPVADSIVDLGCGPGKLLAELSRLFPAATLVGLDRSQPMLDLAQALVPDSVLLVRASFDAIPFDAGTFDVAVATAVFHHTDDLPGLLQESRRILKRDGRLVCVAYRRDAPRCTYELARLHSMWRRISGSRLEGFRDVLRGSWTRAEIERDLRGAGFLHVEVQAGPVVLTAAASR